MKEHRPSVHRRTVLKATGAAAVVPVGIAATVTADHVIEGECARVIYDVQSYGPGCLDDNPQDYFYAGEEGSILKECVDNDGNHKVHFAANQKEGWIPHDYVEPC